MLLLSILFCMALSKVGLSRLPISCTSCPIHQRQFIVPLKSTVMERTRSLHSINPEIVDRVFTMLQSTQFKALAAIQGSVIYVGCLSQFLRDLNEDMDVTMDILVAALVLIELSVVYTGYLMNKKQQIEREVEIMEAVEECTE